VEQFAKWVVSANTNTFKTRLDKFWHNQDITYNFRAHLQGTGRVTGQLADSPNSRIANSRTGHLADWSSNGLGTRGLANGQKNEN